MEDTDNGNSSSSSSLSWTDYLEVVILVVACLLGLLGNMAVLRVSLRIRSFSRQISLLFSGLLCADVLVCATRIPTTVYLIFASPESHVSRLETSMATTLPLTLTSGLDSGVDVTVVNKGNMMSGGHNKEEEGEGGMHHGGDGDDDMNIDVACEVWAANNALMLTIVWLHLAVGFQRLAIIFSFSKYRKLFTQTLTGLMVLGAWLIGLVVVYTPLRAVGMPMVRAGRGACEADDTTPDGLFVARSASTAFLCLLPLLITIGCYAIVMRSVWRAREVRTESATEYNRVVFVTLLRLLSLVLTYFPVCLLLMAEVKPGMVPEAAHRYVGHLLWLQSVISPFVTLQDNDFREKLLVPNKHSAGTSKNGVDRHVRPGGGEEEEDGGVMPDIGSSGGQDGDEHRARNLQEMNRENRRSQLARGICVITSADMRTIRGSSD